MVFCMMFSGSTY